MLKECLKILQSRKQPRRIMFGWPDEKWVDEIGKAIVHLGQMGQAARASVPELIETALEFLYPHWSKNRYSIDNLDGIYWYDFPFAYRAMTAMLEIDPEQVQESLTKSFCETAREDKANAARFGFVLGLMFSEDFYRLLTDGAPEVKIAGIESTDMLMSLYYRIWQLKDSIPAETYRRERKKFEQAVIGLYTATSTMLHHYPDPMALDTLLTLLPENPKIAGEVIPVLENVWYSVPAIDKRGKERLREQMVPPLKSAEEKMALEKLVAFLGEVDPDSVAGKEDPLHIKAHLASLREQFDCDLPLTKIAPVVEYLEHEDPEVRLHAIWVLDYHPHLMSFIEKSGSDPLARSLTDRLVGSLAAFLESGNTDFRSNALTCLERMRSERSFPPKKNHAPYLLPFHRQNLVSALIVALGDPNHVVREKAVQALGNFQSDAKDAVPALQRARKDGDSAMLRKTMHALLKICPSAITGDELLDLLDKMDKLGVYDWQEQVDIINSIAAGGTRDPKVADRLMEIMQRDHESPDVIMASLRALGTLGITEAIPEIQKKLGH